MAIIEHSPFSLRAVQFRRGIKPFSSLILESLSLRAVQFRRGIKRDYTIPLQGVGLRAVQFRRGIKLYDLSYCRKYV